MPILQLTTVTVLQLLIHTLSLPFDPPRDGVSIIPKINRLLLTTHSEQLMEADAAQSSMNMLLKTPVKLGPFLFQFRTLSTFR